MSLLQLKPGHQILFNEGSNGNVLVVNFFLQTGLETTDETN